MKAFRNILFYTLLGLTILAADCPGDDPVPAGETQSGHMEGTWTVVYVKSDGSEFLAGDWSNFTITFSNAEEGDDEIWGGEFATSGRPSDEYAGIWPTSGTWKFESTDVVSKIFRNDGMDVSLAIIYGSGPSTMTLSFFSGNQNGRMDGISNTSWEFKMTQDE